MLPYRIYCDGRKSMEPGGSTAKPLGVTAGGEKERPKTFRKSSRTLCISTLRQMGTQWTRSLIIGMSRKHPQFDSVPPRIKTSPSLSVGFQKSLQELAQLYWDSREEEEDAPNDGLLAKAREPNQKCHRHSWSLRVIVGAGRTFARQGVQEIYLVSLWFHELLPAYKSILRCLLLLQWLLSTCIETCSLL